MSFLRGKSTSFTRFILPSISVPQLDEIVQFREFEGIPQDALEANGFCSYRNLLEASIDRGHLDATSLMEGLIAAGIPQRTAHETVGKLVRRAMRKGVALADLSDEEFSADCADWNASLRGALGASRAVERMASFGSTAPARVAEQIRNWQRRLSDDGA